MVRHNSRMCGRFMRPQQQLRAVSAIAVHSPSLQRVARTDPRDFLRRGGSRCTRPVTNNGTVRQTGPLSGNAPFPISRQPWEGANKRQSRPHDGGSQPGGRRSPWALSSPRGTPASEMSCTNPHIQFRYHAQEVQTCASTHLATGPRKPNSGIMRTAEKYMYLKNGFSTGSTEIQKRAVACREEPATVV